MVQLTIGMHYDNPLCRGVISLGHVGDNAANGRPSFHTIYDNLHLGDQQSIVFSYEPGYILRIVEYDTCIVHMCKFSASADTVRAWRLDLLRCPSRG